MIQFFISMLLIIMKGVLPCAFEMLQGQKETFYKQNTKFLVVHFISFSREYIRFLFLISFTFSYHICVNFNFLCLHFMLRHF